MSKIDKIVDQTFTKSHVSGISLTINYRGKTETFLRGNFQSNSQYFIASTTKLFISALTYQLIQQHTINFDDLIQSYLDKATIDNLHILKGKDYSNAITIQHLLAHTSGLSDYFQSKRNDGSSLMKDLLSGKDQYWSPDEAIEWSKSMQPKFIPGQKGKAFYSDTNYQLLGKVIEKIHKKDLKTILNENIIHPLGLKNTYMYDNTEDQSPELINYKNSPLSIPKAMCSFGADGGIVSNSEEMMIFLRAFFGGQLFDKNILDNVQDWNPIFFPLQSGIGIHRFRIPWYFSPFKKLPPLIGHSGLSGAFAFYCQEHDIYLTGTVNQIHKPGTSFQMMVRLIHTLS